MSKKSIGEKIGDFLRNVAIYLAEKSIKFALGGLALMVPFLCVIIFVGWMDSPAIMISLCILGGLGAILFVSGCIGGILDWVDENICDVFYKRK